MGVSTSKTPSQILNIPGSCDLDFNALTISSTSTYRGHNTSQLMKSLTIALRSTK